MSNYSFKKTFYQSVSSIPVVKSHCTLLTHYKVKEASHWSQSGWLLHHPYLKSESSPKCQSYWLCKACAQGDCGLRLGG